MTDERPSEGAGTAPAGAVLALETTGGRCAAAILTSGGDVLLESEIMARGHAERLFPLLETLLQRADLAWTDFRLFAAVRGPGSFTGVRLGLAAARGLALARGAPAVGLDGFAVIAEAARRADVQAAVAAIVFGKPPRLVQRRFRLCDDGWAPLGAMEPAGPPPPGDDPIELVLGPSSGSCGDVDFGGARPALDKDPRFREIDVVLAARLAAAGSGAAGPPAPLYLRPPDAAPSQEARPRRLGPRG